MHAKIGTLLATIEHIGDPDPDDLVTSLQKLPEPGALPWPWETWTLIGLVRHHKRQLWVAEVIRKRLQGAPVDLAVAGALGHPAGVPQSGPVPGMPEWEYRFHGRGCCISHKVDGDAIDVDFFDDSANYFDTHFYQNYLESLRRPEPPEQRLRELHPSIGAMTVAVTDLLAAGALTPLPGDDLHPYRLADEVLAVADAFESFCAAWSHMARRVWLAARIGDWIAADVAANESFQLSVITVPRSEQCREKRQLRLRRQLGNPGKGADALRALAHLSAPDLDLYLEQALSGSPSGLISAALDIIGQQDDSRWCAHVYKLFSRVDPEGQIPQPHIWLTSLKFLLRHSHRSAEMKAALSECGRTQIGEAVLLSLEYAPEQALPLIRRGLLSDVPMDRIQVAAILAVMNTPWTRRELRGALERSDEQETTADARAALIECGDDDDQKAVANWEERNPHEAKPGGYLEIGGRRLGPFYSLSEHMLKDRAAWIQHEMAELHDRMMKLKGVVPPRTATAVATVGLRSVTNRLIRRRPGTMQSCTLRRANGYAFCRTLASNELIC